MKISLLLSFVTLHLLATDFTITVLDDSQQPLAATTVEALCSRMNDPRESSQKSFDGLTDTRGEFHFSAPAEMILIRLQARKVGYFEADADRRHNLGSVPSQPHHTLTLPARVPGIPLCYKDVQLSTNDGQLPPQTWVGFDLARGEVVAPWGKGEISDISFWNEGGQNGWSQSAETITRLRKDASFARLSDREFAAIYGVFQGVTRLRADRPGAGILRTPAYWSYSPLKMPAEAPAGNYVSEVSLPYGMERNSEDKAADTSFFLRVRPLLAADGRVLSAHYAKIQGPVTSTLGRIDFRYYYNPVRDDRRLVHDLTTNLLRPPAGTDLLEQQRYQSFER